MVSLMSEGGGDARPVPASFWKRRARWAAAAVTTCSMLGCGGAAGVDSSADGLTCGQAGEVVSIAATGATEASAFDATLEPFIGCERYRGTLHLQGVEVADSVAALRDLVHIEGSLLVAESSAGLGSLAGLRSVAGRAIFYYLEEAPAPLPMLESAGALWLYDGSFTDLDWLPKLARVERSMIARRNSQLPRATLEAFAEARASGAQRSLTDTVPEGEADPLADAMPCGKPDETLLLSDPSSLQGCTRILGSLHLSDVSTAEQLSSLSTLITIDGSLSLFRNHTDDFSALRRLRRVGARFQAHLLNSEPQGFENLREVGELIVPRAGELKGFDWLPALKTVRESALVTLEGTLSQSAVTELLTRVEVGGEVLAREL